MLDKRLVIIEDPIKEVFRIGAPINDKRITTRAKYRGRDRRGDYSHPGEKFKLNRHVNVNFLSGSI